MIDRKRNTVRMVLLAAERMKARTIKAGGEEGSYDLTFAGDRVATRGTTTSPRPGGSSACRCRSWTA